MATKPDTAAPSWLVPGAEVVLYTLGGAGTPRNVTTTTVHKVTGKSFSVADPHEPRFTLPTCSARAGSWGTRHVVPIDSDTARAELDGQRQRTQVDRARAAVESWERNRTRANRLAAIKALQAIEDEADH